MTDDALIEKVARAMCRASYERAGWEPELLDDIVDRHWRYFQASAGPAIEAARPAIRQQALAELRQCASPGTPRNKQSEED